METNTTTAKSKLSAGDARDLAYIERELARNDLTAERRADLIEARGDIGEANRTDISIDD